MNALWRQAPAAFRALRDRALHVPGFPLGLPAVAPAPAAGAEVVLLKRPRFAEQTTVRAVLDTVEIYRPAMEHCDLAAAYFRVCALSRGRSAVAVLVEEPRFSRLVSDLRAPSVGWRREDVAAACRGTAYIRLADPLLHAALGAAARKKAEVFTARELANVISASPLVAPADPLLHGRLAKRALALAPHLSPKEICTIMFSTARLKPVPAFAPLLDALCEAGVATAPRFGASEVASALRSARAHKLQDGGPTSLVGAMLGRLPTVLLDMAARDLRTTLAALREYGHDRGALGARVRSELDFKTAGTAATAEAEFDSQPQPG